jgi:hypothetical protein
MPRLRIAVAALALSSAPAAAYTTPLMLLDWMIEKSQKEAAATPGHAQWCANSRPGYRAQWNNWRTPDGRVTYCSSPYYSLPWRPYAK